MEENSLLIETGVGGGGHIHYNELIPRVMAVGGHSSPEQWWEPEVHCSKMAGGGDGKEKEVLKIVAVDQQECWSKNDTDLQIIGCGFHYNTQII